MTSLTYRITIHVVLTLMALIALPGISHASYTMYGQEFETLEELAAFVQEYNRIYAELRGTSDTGPRTQSTTPTTSTRVSTPTRGADVTTRNAQAIDMYQARLVGTVNTTGTLAVRVWFEYGPYGQYLQLRTPAEILYKDRSLRTFDSELRNLTHNTTYYYRAVAVNDAGVITYGTVKTFKTAVDPRKDTAAVRAQTSGAKNIDEKHATLNATIDFRKAAYARVWFEYGDEATDLYKRTPIALLTPTMGKTYARSIGGLSEKTTYFFRVVAEDPSGARSYGKTYRFVTRADIINEKPKLVLNRATSITKHDALLTGLIDMNDFRNGVAFLVYGEDRAQVSTIAREYTRYRSIREDGDYLQKVLLDDDFDGLGDIEEKLLFLDIGTTYYVALGVEYENQDGKDVILMSPMTTFKTAAK